LEWAVRGIVVSSVVVANHARNPKAIAQAYTPDSVWRNRTAFLSGTADIENFLTKKWEKERSYRLRKELFAFSENKIAVQFWYEFQDAYDGMKWKRCYGLEDWTFAEDGKMRKRQMSGNDIEIDEARECFQPLCNLIMDSEAQTKVRVERWFKEGVDVNVVEISESHW
jgi:nuclear transport factor 2 (NTF2) superfamily protein